MWLRDVKRKCQVKLLRPSGKGGLISSDNFLDIDDITGENWYKEFSLIHSNHLPGASESKTTTRDSIVCLDMGEPIEIRPIYVINYCIIMHVIKAKIIPESLYNTCGPQWAVTFL